MIPYGIHWECDHLYGSRSSRLTWGDTHSTFSHGVCSSVLKRWQGLEHLNKKSKIDYVVTISDADPDPGSGALLNLSSEIRDELFTDSRFCILDPGSGSLLLLVILNP